jgi:hypothetical protein
MRRQEGQAVFNYQQAQNALRLEFERNKEARLRNLQADINQETAKVHEWEVLSVDLGPRLEAAEDKKEKDALLHKPVNIELLRKAAAAADIKSANMDNESPTRDFECPITLEKPMINPFKHTLKDRGIECGWTTKATELEKLIQKNAPCAQCGRVLTRQDVSPNVALQQRIDLYYKSQAVLEHTK